jgi:hypothetical protein
LMITIVGDARKQENDQEQDQPFKKLEWTDWHRRGRKDEDTIESGQREIAPYRQTENFAPEDKACYPAQIMLSK